MTTMNYYLLLSGFIGPLAVITAPIDISLSGHENGERQKMSAGANVSVVTMKHLLHGTRRELQKMGRLVEVSE